MQRTRELAVSMLSMAKTAAAQRQCHRWPPSLKHARNIIRLKKKMIRTHNDALKMISISMKDEMKKLKFVRITIELEEFEEYTSEEDVKIKNNKS